jgi:hypothetical protein
MAKSKCCQSYRDKKACKDCPVLLALREERQELRRKDVRMFLKTQHVRETASEAEESYMCAL